MLWQCIRDDRQSWSLYGIFWLSLSIGWFVRSYNREWRIQYFFLLLLLLLLLLCLCIRLLGHWRGLNTATNWTQYTHTCTGAHTHTQTHIKRVINIHLYENCNANDIRREKKNRFEHNTCELSVVLMAINVRFFIIHFFVCYRSSNTPASID